MPPPQDNITKKISETQNNSDAAGVSTYKNAGPIPIETIPAKEPSPLPKPAAGINEKGKAETSEETPEIPFFDLADEIMAEQRKITAIRRRAPGQKIEAQGLKPETQIVDHSIEQRKPLLSEQEKIIAEIVARDIERLCRGNYTGEQRLQNG
jgi:hypothetical protein